jgi:hypothetical protein
MGSPKIWRLPCRFCCKVCVGSQLRSHCALSGGDAEQLGDKARLSPHVSSVDLISLPLSDDRHRFVARQCSSRCAHVAEAGTWSDQPLHTAMVLLNDVVQVLGLSQASEAP